MADVALEGDEAMSVQALHGSGAIARRSARAPAASRRLAWISVILGCMSLDLVALALFSAILPSPRWYADLLLLYGPTTVVTAAMLALGGPLALAGLLCAGATVRRGRVPLATLLGVALCSVSIAIPLCFAVFVVTYLHGLL
jgi:hypothetical protein